MLFSSFEFIFLLLPITFFIYFILIKRRLIILSKLFLVVSSLFFYSWWNIIYLPLILISMIFNYIVGTALTKKKEYKQISKKQLLVFAICANVGLLGYFKYSDFFINNVNFAFNSNLELLNLALPLAISFFTFQQIAYLVDSYRKETNEYNFLNYALFVTFFPQLIAGPIVHHKEMMPQFILKKNLIINYRNISLGIFIFSIGLFKKIVIADTFAIWANYGFDETISLNFINAWLSLLSYSFQLYFDFSGYTDMAIGAALLFNIKLPINFNSPYKAKSIIEIWERWHITLSNFINSYIFKPIIKSFNKYSFVKGMIAVFLSMLISGLWHGASWMFVLFGAIHGMALIINHIWKKKVKIYIYPFVGWFLTFFTWNIALVFFRSKDWDTAVKMLKGLFDFSNFYALTNSSTIELSYNISFIILGFILILFTRNSNELGIIFNNKKSLTLYFLSIFCFGLSLIIISLQTGSEFLYFNF